MSTAATLYKYLQASHALDLAERGTLRIGTLRGYRDVEEQGSTIGDADEGRRIAYVDPDTFDFREPDNVPSIVKEVIKVPPEGAGIILEGIGFQVESESPDCYIYSVSTRCSSDLMRTFGYDACVEIQDSQAFFQTLTQHLVLELGILGGRLAQCIYTPRRQHHATKPLGHPALLKDPTYAEQREVRAVWTPRSQPIQGRVITCPELSKYCAVVVPP